MSPKWKAGAAGQRKPLVMRRDVSKTGATDPGRAAAADRVVAIQAMRAYNRVATILPHRAARPAAGPSLSFSA